MIKTWNTIAFFMLLASCGGVAPFRPGPPLPSDADAAEQCDAICERLWVMQCEGWEGNIGPDGIGDTEDDSDCERACVDVQAVVPLNADCIVAAGSCAAVDACEVE